MRRWVYYVRCVLTEKAGGYSLKTVFQLVGPHTFSQIQRKPSLLLFCSQVTGSAAESQEPGLDIETATRKNRKETKTLTGCYQKAVYLT